MNSKPSYMQLIKSHKVNESYITKDLILFASKTDIPYRLKKIDSIITLYGHEFTKDAHWNILSSIGDANKIKRGKLVKHEMHPLDYKHLLITPLRDLEEKINSIISEDENEEFIKIYKSQLNNAHTKNSLTYFLNEESEKRKNPLLNQDIADSLLNNSHLEKF